MIIVEDVHKRYKTDHGPGKWVLQGVSFTIPLKLNVALIGHNGAGKSTILRLIGGIDTPTRGRIERRCRVSPPMGFGIGIQGSLTGRQNARFACRIYGQERDIPEHLAFIEEFAGLGDAFDKPVKTYSTGMRSRLQFGLMLAFDFDIFISDEVTTAGDAAFKEKAAAAFRKLADRTGLIMVSHAENTLREFCTAGIFLHEGKAHWFDDIDDALTEYKKSRKEAQASDPTPEQATPNKEPAALDIARARQQQRALALIEQGKNGSPKQVDHEEGSRIIRAAYLAGVELVGLNQIAKRGYQLKPGATPVLRKFVPERNQHADIFDLHTQCVKVENVQ